MSLIDCHCHIDYLNYAEGDSVFSFLRDNYVINNSVDYDSSVSNLEISKEYPNMFIAVGIHPTAINGTVSQIEELVLGNKHKVIAIGEIGLDYYHKKDNIEEQKRIFIEQLELARKYNLVAIIHMRDSDADMFDILKDFSDVKKVIHSYSGSLSMAREFIKIGCFLGISGVVTFKNAKRIKEVVEGVSIDYLLSETDSPYLTPEPFRGKKNTPENVQYVVRKIAELKGETYIDIKNKLLNNAAKLFCLKLT